MIGGAAIANFVHALSRQRATAPRPLVDYHTALLLQPLTMGGSILGILLNRLLPDWLILIILIIVLIYTLYTTAIKFIKVWKHDATMRATERPVIVKLEDLKPEENGASAESSETADTDEVALEVEKVEALETEAEQDNKLQEQKRAELEAKEQRIPWMKLGLCFIVLFLVTLHSIFIGGKGGPSVIGIQSCSTLYWVLLFLIFPCLGVASWIIGSRMVADYHLKRQCGFQFLNSDIEWSPKRTYVTMAVSVGAGMTSSLLGIGGGMLINPLLLELGVAPDCTAATSSLMILFTALSAVAQYGIIGRIQWDYAAVLFVLGLVGCICGQHGLGYIVKKYKSQAYILLAMLLIMFPGGILLVFSALKDLITGIKAGADLGLKNMCHPS